jgi:Cof subfamily protein (haloacid dehalogenase superfamily)
MTIKHIFTDMDGTLLDAHGNLSDTNHWSIYYSDLPITLVSARSPLEMSDIIDKLQLSTPQIAFNGNLTFTQNQFGLQIIDKNILDSETVSQLLDYISTEFPNVSLSWYSLAHWYINKQDKRTFIQKALTGIEPKIKAFNGKSEIYKIMMIVFDANELQRLKAQLDALNIPNVSIQQSGQWYLEITSSNKTKADAVQTVLDNENIEFKEIAAIGDGHNDIPLLQSAGFAIAVENASPEVKKHVKMVVSKNIDHGVAEAISAINTINEQVIQ